QWVLAQPPPLTLHYPTLFRPKACDGGAIILGIARSEIAYTDQRPEEYVAVMIGAALREGYQQPVFIQGDHCQVNAKKYAADAERSEEHTTELQSRENTVCRLL